MVSQIQMRSIFKEMFKRLLRSIFILFIPGFLFSMHLGDNIYCRQIRNLSKGTAAFDDNQQPYSSPEVYFFLFA